jgi:hypothetical protein
MLDAELLLRSSAIIVPGCIGTAEAVVNQVEHPSRKTCRDTLPPNARLLLLARLRMHARLV